MKSEDKGAPAAGWSWTGNSNAADRFPKALQLTAVEAAMPATTDVEVCPRCGTKRRDEGRFCGKCGKPLDVPESPRDEPTSPRALSIGQKSSDNI